jgi:hypothetical protein
MRDKRRQPENASAREQPRRIKAVETDQPMEEPFTEQGTHPAGEGQGANRVQSKKRAPGENEEDAMPVEEGFSPIP